MAIKMYTVQPGDCLTMIAERHGMTYDELIRMNPQFQAGVGYRDPELIYVEEVLVVRSTRKES